MASTALASIETNDSMYQTLDPAAKEIRLVRIHFEADETLPIHLTMKCVSLADQPVYETLSYTWGAPHPTYEIEVHRTDATTTKFSVRQNLRDFLVQFRKEQNETWLWIDQICINQEDLEERSHQVMQMAQIYSQAVQVNVWLGSGFQGGDELMDFISIHDQLPFHIKGSVIESDQSFEEKNTWLKKFVEKAATIYHKYIQQCRRFILLPYWGRLWIIQEIALSSIRVIRLGTKIVSWTALLLFLHMIVKASEILRLPFERNEATRICGFDYYAKRNIMAFESLYALIHLITLSITAQCEDKRDCIYGILGLLPDHLRVVPDYNHDSTLQKIMFAVLSRSVENSFLQLENNKRATSTLSHKDIALLTRKYQEKVTLSMIVFCHLAYLVHAFDPSGYDSRAARQFIQNEISARYRRQRSTYNTQKSPHKLLEWAFLRLYLPFPGHYKIANLQRKILFHGPFIRLCLSWI